MTLTSAWPTTACCFYVIDEAHNLPGKAAAAFASSHFVHADACSAEKLAALAASLANADATRCGQIQRDALRLKDILAEAFSFFASLEQLRPSTAMPQPTLMFERPCLPEGFFDYGENVVSLTGSLAAALGACGESLDGHIRSEPTRLALFERLLSEAGFHAGRVENTHETWSLLLSAPEDDEPPVAKWVEAVASCHQMDFQVNASPVLAMGREVWP